MNGLDGSAVVSGGKNSGNSGLYWPAPCGLDVLLFLFIFRDVCKGDPYMGRRVPGFQ